MKNDKPEQIRDIAPFGLRMQKGLRDTLMEAARANGRSMNSEIVQRLLESLSQEARQWNASGSGRRTRGAPDSPTGYGRPPTEAERVLLNAYRSLKPEAQLGFVAFLRGVVKLK